jgi:hypothetical protein
MADASLSVLQRHLLLHLRRTRCFNFSTSPGRSRCRIAIDSFRAVIKQPLQVFARPAQLVANSNATIGVSKKYQEAFGDIWGSGQNAQALATRPMHETIHISHQSKVNPEPIRAPA